MLLQIPDNYNQTYLKIDGHKKKALNLNASSSNYFKIYNKRGAGVVFTSMNIGRAFVSDPSIEWSSKYSLLK